MTFSRQPACYAAGQRDVVSRLRYFARRSILIYVATVVVPIGALLWLGLQSFERQREALETLRRQTLEAAVDAESRAAAAMAFQTRRHPIAKTFFVLQQGRVVEPALRSPLPQPTTAGFAEPDPELARRRPDLALPIHRPLAQRHEHESIALQLTARCLTSLGHPDEAKATWRAWPQSFPDDRNSRAAPTGLSPPSTQAKGRPV